MKSLNTAQKLIQRSTQSIPTNSWFKPQLNSRQHFGICMHLDDSTKWTHAFDRAEQQTWTNTFLKVEITLSTLDHRLIFTDITGLLQRKAAHAHHWANL